jgi:HEAT repeat protein
MRIGKALCVVLLFTAGGLLSAQESRVPATALKEWEQTLDYGIDSQILEVVKKIRESKETALNGKLLAILASSVNTALRKEILEYFADTKYKEAEDTAYAILANYENEDPDLLRSLVRYLAEIRSKKSMDLILSLVDADDNVLAVSAIYAIGRMGDTAQAELLLKKLRDPETPSGRKPTIITALGDMHAEAAVPELTRIVQSRDEERIWRMYACEALGKIGDAASVPVLKRVMAEQDPLLKAYASAALAQFDLGQVLDVLIECLKDSYWKVRVAGCQGLARPGAEKAVDILIYKVDKDPEVPVRNEAIKALAAIGDDKALGFLRALIADKGKNAQLREFTFDTLVDKNLTAETVAAVERMVKQEWDSRDRLLESISRKLMNLESAQLKRIYILFLDHPDYVIRISGIRGVARNRFTDLKPKLQDMERKDRVEQVRNEAKAALEKL